MSRVEGSKNMYAVPRGCYKKSSISFGNIRHLEEEDYDYVEDVLITIMKRTSNIETLTFLREPSYNLKADKDEVTDCTGSHSFGGRRRVVPACGSCCHERNLRSGDPLQPQHRLSQIRRPESRETAPYDLHADELQSGLHALSIVAKTPQETSAK
ncbi:hypothetical protein K1719_030213 [Acacia pycnantha]|nr:hypothetical protein K1719_030213 [Acacia pycnantha]